MVHAERAFAGRTRTVEKDVESDRRLDIARALRGVKATARLPVRT